MVNIKVLIRLNGLNKVKNDKYMMERSIISMRQLYIYFSILNDQFFLCIYGKHDLFVTFKGHKAISFASAFLILLECHFLRSYVSEQA